MTTLNPTLLHELQSAPAPVQQEVLDFLLFIKRRYEKDLSRGIEHTPGVCGGDACVASTRIPVWTLEQSRRLGFTDEELLNNYPTLSQGDLAAAWAYAMAHPTEIENAIRDNEEA